MLMAEDLLLLVTDDDTGKLATSSTAVDVALGGALLVELTLAGRLDLAGTDERVRTGRLVVRDSSPTGDALLDDALAIAAQKEGKRPRSAVTPLGKHVRARLYERLTAGGVLHAEENRVLGIFPTHRWPAADTSHELSIRTGITTALRQGTTTDQRTGALVSLLHALGVVHKVVDPAEVGLSAKQLKANAKRIAKGDWAAEAVRQAIESTNAAIIAATTSSTLLAGSSGPG